MKLFRSQGPKSKGPSQEEQDLLNVLDATQAVIHFKPSGEILYANDNFLAAVGYALEEVKGQHHRIFVPADEREGAEYAEFWNRLEAGESFTRQYARVRKTGELIHIQATYYPVVDDTTGTVRRVIKIASDVTDRQHAIEELERGLDALRRGDLMYRVPSCDAADIDALGDTFNKAQAQLMTLVRNVQGVAGDVNSTAAQVASATDDLSKRTETTAATLEETAAAVDELTSTVRSSAESATTVVDVTHQTRSAAEGGRQLVTELTDAMARIETSADQISQIISVIEGIAFQTNLLALNAGVEAARAGESGRGFAVVASEVRQLAQRSSESAMEIKTLIESSSNNVSQGSDLVARTNTEFTTIFEGISSISGHVQEITNSVNEQAQTLSEINTSVSQMDQVTQNNAAMVEETSATTTTLMQSAQNLMTEVSFFDVQGGKQATGNVGLRAVG